MSEGFMIAGLLPALALDLGVGLPAAGHWSLPSPSPMPLGEQAAEPPLTPMAQPTCSTARCKSRHLSPSPCKARAS
jgi:hypothetical protein